MIDQIMLMMEVYMINSFDNVDTENVIEIMKNDKLFFKLIQQGKETAKNLDWNKSVVQFEKAISFYR